MLGLTPEELRYDIYSHLQGLPGTAVCWRRGDGQLGVYPRDETVFKAAFRTIQFSFAIKVRIPAIQAILIHRYVN